jgi:hypothetical protein
MFPKNGAIKTQPLKGLAIAFEQSHLLILVYGDAVLSQQKKSTQQMSRRTE